MRVRNPFLEGRWGFITAELTNLEHVPEIAGLLLTTIDLERDEHVPSLGRTEGPSSRSPRRRRSASSSPASAATPSGCPFWVGGRRQTLRSAIPPQRLRGSQDRPSRKAPILLVLHVEDER